MLCILTSSLGAARTQKLVKKYNQPKKDNFGVPPQGVDQLLQVDQLCGVDKIKFFLLIFRRFFC